MRMSMKTAVAIAFVCSLSAARPLYAKVPTGDDIRKDILPALLLCEIADLRMAEFELPDKPPIVDLTVVDLSQWGNPNCSEVSFRVFFKATKDIYQHLFRNDDEGKGFTLMRVGIAGKQYAIEFKCTVKSETEPGPDGVMRTGFKFAKEPYRGDWAMENSALLLGGDIGSRAAWETIAAATGGKVCFFDSPRDIGD